MSERTLVLIKPDAVRRGLVGEILGRFERKGLAIEAMVLRTMDADLADQHYAEHVDKPFYPPLKEFMTGGPLVAAGALRRPGDRGGPRRWSARPTAARRPPAPSAATCPCPTGRTWCTPPTRPTAPSGRSPSGSPTCRSRARAKPR